MPLPQIERRPLASGETGLQQSAGIVAEAQGNLWGSLADAARGLRQRFQPQLDDYARNQASEDLIEAAEAREAGRTMLDLPARSVLTRQDQVYNEVLRSGIAAQAMNDFTETARALEEKYQYDPEGFDNEAKMFMDSYTGFQDADSFLVLEIDREGQKLFADTRYRIDGRKRQADLVEKQQALEARLGHLQGEMATVIEQGGPGSVYGADYGRLQDQAIDIVNQLVDNPAFGWSDEKGAEALDALANQQQELVEIKVMESIYYAPTKEGGGVIKAMEYIDTAVNRMQLDQGERIGARSRMQQRLAWLQQKDALEEKEKEDQHKALKEKGEQTAQAFEAELLSRMGRGGKPTTQDIDYMAAFVTAGWMDPSRMSTYVNAATSTAPTRSDELVLASLFDLARTPGTTKDQIEIQSLHAMSDVTLSASDRERVIKEWEDAQDERIAPGMSQLDGFFATGFMDIDTASVKASKAWAESELRAFVRSNPDATVPQVERKAKDLAVQAGRRMPRPPMPSIPGYGNPAFVTLENVDSWASSARIATDSAFDQGRMDTSEYVRTMQMIEEQVAWQREQARLMQETVSNADQ